jgi:FtsH-binding integral membrane protein|tara:strand:+ start:1750 stop:2238 length:489 start_codon:yes stop_codon:yes gene_type:complete
MHLIKKTFKEKILLNDKDPYSQQWQNIVFQALIATTSSVFITLLVVYITDIDFGFLGLFLLISLWGLLIINILNAFIFKSIAKRLYLAYAGIVLFNLYLVYDFNRLEQAVARGDQSWETAIRIVISLYLDIINFIYRFPRSLFSKCLIKYLDKETHYLIKSN